ncbi:MAG: hypothetical protein GX755_05425, partial [Syntrophomonadaceae bacterium]|nr:hypothetical protein [Syntrophomonadaceae bacterium]
MISQFKQLPSFKSILKDELNGRWHYLIWFALIIKLLIPFGPESAVSLFNVMPEMPQTSLAEVYYEMAQQYEASI